MFYVLARETGRINKESFLDGNVFTRIFWINKENLSDRRTHPWKVRRILGGAWDLG